MLLWLLHQRGLFDPLYEWWEDHFWAAETRSDRRKHDHKYGARTHRLHKHERRRSHEPHRHNHLIGETDYHYHLHHVHKDKHKHRRSRSSGILRQVPIKGRDDNVGHHRLLKEREIAKGITKSTRHSDKCREKYSKHKYASLEDAYYNLHSKRKEWIWSNYLRRWDKLPLKLLSFASVFVDYFFSFHGGRRGETEWGSNGCWLRYAYMGFVGRSETDNIYMSCEKRFLTFAQSFTLMKCIIQLISQGGYFPFYIYFFLNPTVFWCLDKEIYRWQNWDVSRAKLPQVYSLAQGKRSLAVFSLCSPTQWVVVYHLFAACKTNPVRVDVKPEFYGILPLPIKLTWLDSCASSWFDILCWFLCFFDFPREMDMKTIWKL